MEEMLTAALCIAGSIIALSVAVVFAAGAYKIWDSLVVIGGVAL